MNSRLCFPGQKHDEVIRILLRKHWIIDVKSGMFYVLFGIAPISIFVVLMFWYWEMEWTVRAYTLLLALLAYSLFILLLTYVKWLNEEMDVVIVTNERIVSHNQVDIFHKEISECSIGQIQDVKGVEKGFFGNMLNYGELDVQTAARDVFFNIKRVDRPYESARAILDLRDTYIDNAKTS